MYACQNVYSVYDDLIVVGYVSEVWKHQQLIKEAIIVNVTLSKPILNAEDVGHLNFRCPDKNV